jgi:hypothetical protein
MLEQMSFKQSADGILRTKFLNLRIGLSDRIWGGDLYQYVHANFLDKTWRNLPFKFFFSSAKFSFLTLKSQKFIGFPQKKSSTRAKQILVELK